MPDFAETSHPGMSTVFTHRAFGSRAQEALRAVKAEAERLEKLLSRFIPESEVSRVNAAAGIQSVPVGEETFKVLARAKELSARSGGLFDVTVGPLVLLWSRGKQAGDAPDETEIQRVMKLVDFTGLLLDPAAGIAGLRSRGQSIDLGGIGKGYAGDKFVEVFRKFGVTSAFTNLGGNVVALGKKPDGSPWRVGIQHPRQLNALLGVLAVEDKAVVTSGDYQRYFVGRDGRSYHHILDPRTGYPADSGIISATVVAENSMDADALSTMLFVVGREKGLALLAQFPGAGAVVVAKDLKVTVTASLEGCFQATDGMDVEVLT